MMLLPNWFQSLPDDVQPPTVKALACELGRSVSAAKNYLYGNRPVPAKLVRAVSRFTGGDCEPWEIRPDVYVKGDQLVNLHDDQSAA